MAYGPSINYVISSSNARTHWSDTAYTGQPDEHSPTRCSASAWERSTLFVIIDV